jgi:hypothetical protein
VLRRVAHGGDGSELLDFVATGTGATMLARRWQSAMLVNVDTDTLAKLEANADLVAALAQMESFRKLDLARNLARSISADKDLKRAKREGRRPSPEENKAGRESKSFRKKLREQLIKFATRVPVFMYLTDIREETLKDVITQLEPDLFERVTNLTVDDFEQLCDLGVFNAAAMNSAIFAFRRFEIASLSYAGNSAVPDAVVGFDSVATIDEVLAGDV